MKKFLTTAFLFTLAVSAFAQQAAVNAQASAGASLFAGKYLYNLALAIAAAVCGLAQGKAVVAACDGIARNPQAAGNIRTTMVIGLALIEALVIYVLISPFLTR
jgi:F-type H+-transporting ATPase subunit c